MDGIVGPLEKEVLTVPDELYALVVVFRVQVLESVTWQHDRNGDVVFYLDFVGRIEIGAQLVNTPRAVGVVSHPKIIAHEFLVFELQLVAEKPVDSVHSEMLSPIVTPVGSVIPFHRNEQLAHSLGNRR